MGQRDHESAKDFIERVRDGHKRSDGSFSHHLPRTVIDPERVTFGPVPTKRPDPDKK